MFNEVRKMPRRAPNQERSRQLVNSILASSMQLIEEKGSTSVSLREISVHAGIAPSSAYQYFNNKNEILLALIEHYFAGTRKIISKFPLQANSIDEILAGVDESIDALFLFYKENPSLAIVMNNLQAEANFQMVDVNSGRDNAMRIAKRICSLNKNKNFQEVLMECELFTHQVGSGVRYALCYESNEEQIQSIEALKRLSKNTMRQLINTLEFL